jgi:hypothetical protein
MNKQSLILVAALAIALVGCNKEKEEATVPMVNEQQQEQPAVAQVQQNAPVGVQQQAPAVEAQAPVAPEASAPVAAPAAPITPATLVEANSSVPEATPVVPAK